MRRVSVPDGSVKLPGIGDMIETAQEGSAVRYQSVLTEPSRKGGGR